MTSNITSRRTAGAITAALVLGTAGPALARPIGDGGPVPVAPPARVDRTPHYGKANVLPAFVPAHTKAFPETTAPVPSAASAPAASARPKVSHPASGSDLIYVLIGGVVVAVGGLGGSLVAANRRRTAPPRPRIAA
jgi:hypothetical protein